MGLVRAPLVYRFIIPGNPKAKERPRARVINAGDKSFASIYTSKGTKDFESKVREAALCTGMRPIMDGPIYLRVIACWEWPKSAHRKRTPREQEYKDNGPDFDNVVKSVSDALNKIAYRDDSQVARAEVIKLKLAQGEPAKTIVEIYPLDRKEGRMFNV